MSNVDWEGLKARWRLGNPIILPSEFPAILAAHERDQRVIEAAEKCANAAEQARSWMTMPKGVEGEPSTVASVGRRQKQIIAALTDALAEYDKAKV